jgi:WD40 repeat protein
VRLWDPATGKQLARLTGHTETVSAVAFSPDGKTLATAGFDTIRVWKEMLWSSSTDLHTTVCDLLLQGLSRPEWAQYAPGIPYRRSCP